MMKMYTIYIQFNNIMLLTYILEFFEFFFFLNDTSFSLISCVLELKLTLGWAYSK